jgi:type III pantothenate kinase
MKLAIDIGNTTIKVGLFESDKLVSVHKMSILEELLVFLELYRENELVFCNVSKSIIGQKLKTAFPQSQEITVDTKLPIFIDYETPQTLGIDRLVACVGAWQLFKKPCLVVDIGTCMTLDVLDEGGIFSGGNISPGPKLRFESMNNFTSNLPLVSLNKESKTIGKSTEEALQSGVKFGILYEIEATYSQLLIKNPDFKLVLTGGYTNFFDNMLKEGIFAEPNLVLKGLHAIQNKL